MAKESSKTKLGGRIAFWLMPDADARAEFEPIVRSLSDRHDAVAFAPHVTIACNQFDDNFDGTALVDQLAGAHPPITLDVLEVTSAEIFTTTLFVRFGNTTALADLRQRVLDCALPPPSGKNAPFDPHLSLLYAHISTGDRAALAQSIVPRQKSYRFDRLRAVIIPGPVNCGADVADWSTLSESTLKTSLFTNSRE